MGQAQSAGLTAATIASSRDPYYRVLIDLDGTGFGGRNWTDVTSDVKRISGDMRGISWGKSIAAMGRGLAASCTVTLRNRAETGSYSGLRYSGTNADGSLYTAIGNGQLTMKRAMVRAGFTSGGTDYSTMQILGYIMQPQENYSGREVSFEIRDRGAGAAFNRRSLPVTEGISPKTYMMTLAGLISPDAVASTDWVFDDGLQVLPYAWLDDETAWNEMGLVAESQMGRVWFDKDGDLHFDDGAHFVKPSSNSYDDPTVSQFTFTTDDFKSIDPVYDPNNIFNHIQVEYQPRYRGEQQAVFSATETWMVPPLDNRTIQCDFRYPAVDVQNPTFGTDFIPVTGSGRQLTGTPWLNSYTFYGTHATVLARNPHTDYTAYIAVLDIYGTPLFTEQSSTYETEDSTSISTYGRRTWRIQNPYIQTYRQAEMIGDVLLARFKDPLQRARIAGARGVATLEVGDRITITESLTGINEDYFIGAIRWNLSPSIGYVMDLEVMRAADLYPNSNYFVLGTSTYGNGSGANDGRMFW